MMKKLMLLAGVLVIAAASPAAAGGWAASTLDEPPAALVAGQDHQVGFMILQHGKTPVNPDQGQVGIRLFDPVLGREPHVPGRATGPRRALRVDGERADRRRLAVGGAPGLVRAAAARPDRRRGLGLGRARGRRRRHDGRRAQSGGGVDGWRIAAVVIAGLLLVAFFTELLLGRRKDRKPVPAPTQA